MSSKNVNIVYHSIRLNLNNEQHRRVHRILLDLNTDIHKSINQFLINAVDSYIGQSGDDVTVSRYQEQKKEPCIIREDLDELRREIKSEIKDEIIMLLFSALTGRKGSQMLDLRLETEHAPEDMEADPAMTNLADMWG